jgi:hypothetical protein
MIYILFLYNHTILDKILKVICQYKGLNVSHTYMKVISLYGLVLLLVYNI